MNELWNNANKLFKIKSSEFLSNFQLCYSSSFAFIKHDALIATIIILYRWLFFFFILPSWFLVYHSQCIGFALHFFYVQIECKNIAKLQTELDAVHNLIWHVFQWI